MAKKEKDDSSSTSGLPEGFTRRGFQIREQAIMEVVKGIFAGRREKILEELDPESGEYVKKTKSLVLLENPVTNEKTAYWENAGLRGALESSEVKEGEGVLIQRLEKIKMRSGRNSGKECNQYDVLIFGGKPEEFRALFEN